jgi:hypothetical protein
VTDESQGLVRVQQSRLRQLKKKLGKLDRELQGLWYDIDRTSSNLECWSRSMAGNHKHYTYWLNHFQKITAQWYKLDQERYEVRCKLRGYDPKKKVCQVREFLPPSW